MSATNDTGGETKIVCSPGDKVAQARYWYRLVRTHRTEVTIRGFLEAAAELTRAHGPEARTLIKEARHIRREYEREQRKALHLTMRSWHHAGKRTLILGYEGLNPIVRGYVRRDGTLCRCPWCGKAELHPANWTEDQITVWCQTYESVSYDIRIERTPLLIPAYIPTREGR